METSPLICSINQCSDFYHRDLRHERADELKYLR